MAGKVRLVLNLTAIYLATCGFVCALCGWWVPAFMTLISLPMAFFAKRYGKDGGLIRTRPPQFQAATFLKIGEKERRRSAFHEAAHCVVAWFNPKALEPVQVRVAREINGDELPAYTAYRPESVDTESGLRASITVSLAGAAADLITYGEKTTGYGHDLEQATERARKMVCRYAMGEGAPFRSFDPAVRDFGDGAADLVSQAIVRILEECRDEARCQVKRRWPEIEKLAAAVMEDETLESDDIAALLGPRPK